MLKRVLINLLMLTVLCAGAGYAENTYHFDPFNPHHSIYIPNGQPPFPAIVMLHPSSGIAKFNYDWAKRLKYAGYIVFVIDSFTPRGWTDRAAVGWEKATAAQYADAIAAYQYLRKQQLVNPNRIGVLGFSMGGFTALRLMQQGQVDNESHFQAAASFYGVCHRLTTNASLKGPTTIFIGANDDRATTADCEQLVARSQGDNAVNMQVYAEGLHGFDNYEFPASKEIIDEQGEHYHIGYNEAARKQVLRDLPVFFDQYLKPKKS